MKYIKVKYYEILIRIQLWRLVRKVKAYIREQEKQNRFSA